MQGFKSKGSAPSVRTGNAHRLTFVLTLWLLVALTWGCHDPARAAARGPLDITGVYVLKHRSRTELLPLWLSKEKDGGLWLSGMGRFWAVDVQVVDGQTMLLPKDKSAPTFRVANRSSLVTTDSLLENMEPSSPGGVFRFDKHKSTTMAKALASLAAGRVFYGIDDIGDRLTLERDERIACRGLTCTFEHKGECHRGAIFGAESTGDPNRPTSPNVISLFAFSHGSSSPPGDCAEGEQPPHQLYGHLSQTFYALLDSRKRVEVLLSVGYMYFKFYVAEGVRLDDALLDRIGRALGPAAEAVTN